MSPIQRALALALAAAALSGCQALGGGGGVMPESEVGPPPSMRGAMKAPGGRAAQVDPDGAPLQTAPTRRLDLPKSGANAQARATADGERRIRREDIEGDGGGRSASSGVGPQLGSGGAVGVGGKF